MIGGTRFFSRLNDIIVVCEAGFKMDRQSRRAFNQPEPAVGPELAKKFAKILGARVLALRTERGWSQEVLADRAGVNFRTLANWERGENMPNLHNALNLVVALNLGS